MFAQSLTGHWLTALWKAFKKAVCGSFFVGILGSVFSWLGEKTKQSFIYSWLGKNVFTEKYYSASIFYTALNRVFSFVIKAITAVRSFFGSIFKNSVTLFVFKKAADVFTIDIILPLFIGLMFVSPHELWNNSYTVMAALVFVFWALSSSSSGKISAGRAEGISLSLIIFGLAASVSTVIAIVFSDALRISMLLISAVLLSLSVYAALDTREKLVRFVRTVLFFVTITAIYAVIQRIMGVEVDLEFVDISANEGMPGRVYSTFSNPNNFAELLILFIPFFVPLFIASAKKTVKLLTAASFAVCIAALAMTYSRSCWVGFAISAVLFVLLYDKRLIIPAAFAVLLAVPFMPETIMNRIFTIGSMNDSSNSYRIYIWDSCLRMIKDFGLTGLGMGPASFKAVYPDYAASVAITAPHSHMLYMELVLEMGLMGFISFFAYMYVVVKRTAGAMRKMDNELRTFAIAGLSSLLGIAFVCCAEYVWFYPRVMFAFWIIPALCLASARIAARERGAERI